MIQKVTSDLAKSFGLKGNKGALVSEVVKGSPADKAGIKSGDVVVRFNDKEIGEFSDLSRYAGLTKPGTTVQLELIREGKKMELTVELGEFEKGEKVAIGKGEEKSDIGITVQDITPELARSFNIKPSEGVLVVDVQSNSLADKAGMQRGDVILEVNRKKLGNTRDFQKGIKASQGDTLLFLVSRDDHLLYIAIGR